MDIDVLREELLCIRMFLTERGSVEMLEEGLVL